MSVKKISQNQNSMACVFINYPRKPNIFKSEHFLIGQSEAFILYYGEKVILPNFHYFS